MVILKSSRSRAGNHGNWCRKWWSKWQLKSAFRAPPRPGAQWSPVEQLPARASVRTCPPCTVSVKKNPPDFSWRFLTNGWEFLVQILQVYYTFLFTLDCKFLFIQLQLWRSYAILSVTTIICSKHPPSVETHAGWSHLMWHNFVKVGDTWIKICSIAHIGTCNRWVKFGPKIPNCFGKMSENASVRFGRW